MRNSTFDKLLKVKQMISSMPRAGTERRLFSMRLTAAICCMVASLFFVNSEAVAAITVTPSTWDTIGLDSNTPASGPNNFPVGARVCTDSIAATNVKATLTLGTGNPNISYRSGSSSSIDLPDILANTCAYAYFEVEVTKDAANFNTTRKYQISVTSNNGNNSTNANRELFVERLVSQGRNAITDMKVGTSIATLTSVPNGGSMSLTKGNTYYIRLIGYTATQGYEQIESFISFNNTLIQILSVDMTGDAVSPISSPTPNLYADPCLWESDPLSPYYRSCTSSGKFGGNITVTYKIKVLSVGSGSQQLNSLIHDFSGSSFHYNADYATTARIMNLVDPALTRLDKSFSPSTINVSGVSTLTFTLTNPNGGAVSGLNFNDIFPALSSTPAAPGNMTLADGNYINTCGGTLANSDATTPLAAGKSGISLSGATVAAFSSCIVQVNVKTDAVGTYTNTSQNLKVDTLDTGDNATASLTVNTEPSPPSPPSTCTNPVTMATWDMEGPPANPAAPVYAGTLGPNVSSMTASYVTVSGTPSFANNIKAPDNTYAWGGTAPTAGDGWKETYNSRANGFQFVIDSSKYGGVTISFDGIPAGNDWANPNSNVFVNTKNNDTNTFACYGGATGPYPQSKKDTWTTISNIPAAATGTGTTTFLIGVDGSGNKSTTAKYSIDNVIFKGCPIPNPPTIKKSFATNPVPVGGTSVLTFEITNPNPCCALTGITFTDNLPQNSLQGTITTDGTTKVTGTGTAFKSQLIGGGAGVGSIIFFNGSSYTVSTITSDSELNLTAAVAAGGPYTVTAGLTLTGAPTQDATYQCGGTLSGAAGGTAISLGGSGGTVAAGGTTFCRINATVKDSIAGPISNVSGPVTSTDSGSIISKDGIAKASITAILPPVISKLFTPNSVLNGGSSTLTFTITNPNQNNSLSSVAFSDTLPVINLSGTVTTNGTINVTGSGTAFQTELIVGSIININGTAYTVATIPSQTTLTLASAPPAGGPYSATAGITLTAAPADDPTYPCGGTRSGASGGRILSLATGSIAKGAFCRITATVKASIIGELTNTSGYVSDTVAGNGNTAEAKITVTPPHPAVGLLKEIATSANPSVWSYYLSIAAGTPVYYKLSVYNDGDVPLTGVTVSDPTIPASVISGCTWKDGETPANTVSYPLSLVVANNSNNKDFAYCITPAVSTTLAGTVDVTNNSTAVTGTLTTFSKQLLAGDNLNINGVTYQIASIASDTQLTLTTNYTGTTASGLTVTVGWHKNTATASVTYNSATYTDTDWATYAATGLTLVKSAPQNYYTTAGNPLGYSYRITNSGSATLVGPVTVSETNVTTSCPQLNSIGNFNNYLEPGEEIVCTGSYTVTAADITNKSITGTATASTPSGFSIAAATSNSDTLTVWIAPTLTKAFSPGTIGVGKTATLTFTVTNPSGTPARTGGLTFTDTFPTNLVIAATPNVVNGCGGSPTITAAADTGIFTVAGTGLNAAAGAGVASSCTIKLDVTSSTPLSGYVNGAGQITAISGLINGVTDQTLAVLQANLTILKSATVSTGNAKARPGDTMTYTVTVAETQGISPETGSVVLTDFIKDSISNYLDLRIDTYGTSPYRPFNLTAGTSGLTLGLHEYSTDGGATWISDTPPNPSGNYDATITNWRLTMNGTMAPSSSFTLSYSVKVK